MAKAGGPGMNDTEALLSKISALRQRLEQAQGLVNEAGAAVADLAEGEDAPARRLAVLQRRAAVGHEHAALLDSALRQMSDPARPVDEGRRLPSWLTARARRVLERGRELLGELRALADDFPEVPPSYRGAAAAPRPRPDPDTPADPLAAFYRETVAMTDTTLRTVQAFPDAPSVQLRLCEGLEAVLSVVGQRLAVLGATVGRRRREAERIDTLADLLTTLQAEANPDVKPYKELAEAILDEAEHNAPLRFLYAAPEEPARFVACHSLTTAQVAARVARGDPEWRGRALEPVLAALVHDAGLLSVPAAVLAHPGPLDDEQRRAVEGHVRAGAALAERLLPIGAWLAEAVAGHHERLDGTGYPAGLRELQIVPLPRLLAVCDVYAALCCPRPHRPARETRTALADTLLLAEQGALDRYHAEKLLHLSFYPVGSVVELADGAVGVVVATPVSRRELSAPARPVLAVLTDGRGRELPLPEHVDLAQCDSRSIVRSLSPAERRDALGRRYPELA
jgi:HD-GYP domain-containing protein (c-di-GMP phosphodiesterase class II)